MDMLFSSIKFISFHILLSIAKYELLSLLCLIDNNIFMNYYHFSYKRIINIACQNSLLQLVKPSDRSYWRMNSKRRMNSKVILIRNKLGLYKPYNLTNNPLTISIIT
jgi:hypothetical protein